MWKWSSKIDSVSLGIKHSDFNSSQQLSDSHWTQPGANRFQFNLFLGVPSGCSASPELALTLQMDGDLSATPRDYELICLKALPFSFIDLARKILSLRCIIHDPATPRTHFESFNTAWLFPFHLSPPPLKKYSKVWLASSKVALILNKWC